MDYVGTISRHPKKMSGTKKNLVTRCEMRVFCARENGLKRAQKSKTTFIPKTFKSRTLKGLLLMMEDDLRMMEDNLD